jgi:hypothetical protein
MMSALTSANLYAERKRKIQKIYDDLGFKEERIYFDGPFRIRTGKEIIEEYNQFETIFHKQRLANMEYIILDNDFKKKLLKFIEDAGAEGVYDEDIHKLKEALEL